MFGGGGSLGAFGCGAWMTLAPMLRDRGARLVGVAGVSIGALQAALLARHGDDLDAGAAALETLWRETATPSFPFAGAFDDHASRRWNGLLTGLLFGNRTLYRPQPLHWNPLAGLDRRVQPLFDRSGMWQWLEANVGTLHAADAGAPLLCVPAVDVVNGEVVVFDNARAPIRTEHVAASAAIPLLFDPVEIEGRLYWDGDITHEPALPKVLARLRERGRLDGGETLLVTIDQMARSTLRTPRTGVAMAHRALTLLLHGKMTPPHELPPGLRHLPIVREPLDHDDIAGHFDYSPSRIAELVEQGQLQAEEAWRALGPRALDTRADAAMQPRAH